MSCSSFQATRPPVHLHHLARIALTLSAAFLTGSVFCTPFSMAQQEQAPANEGPTALPQSPELQSALTALADFLPAVAASKLEPILKQTNWSPQERTALQLVLLEALVRSGKTGEATALTEANPNLAEIPAAQFWIAQAIAKSGRLRKAITLLDSLSRSDSDPFPFETALSLTHFYRAVSDNESALSTIQSLLDNDAKASKLSKAQLLRARLAAAETLLDSNLIDEARVTLKDLLQETKDTRFASAARYLSGLLSLKTENWSKAVATFSALSNLAPSKAPPAVRDGAVIALASALERSGDTAAAVNILSTFISANADSPVLPLAFERLDLLGYFSKPEISESLVQWSTSEFGPLASTATYYLAVAQIAAVSREAAVQTLESFTSSFPDHPLNERALLHLSELYTEEGNKDLALETLKILELRSKNPTVLARVEFLHGNADFSAEDFKKSADRFRLAAAKTVAAAPENGSPSPENTSQSPAVVSADPAAHISSFNAALAALRAENVAAYEATRDAFLNSGITNAELGAELLLERGIFLAARDSATAFQVLSSFLRTAPDHSRAAEAHLALASLYLLEFPPKTKSARKQIEEARATSTNPLRADLGEEADYISFWIEESGGNSKSALALSGAFIARWPASVHAPEIRMKRGEIYLREQDYANAQTQFEKLTREFPDSKYAEAAQFFAGKAAMMIMTESSLENAIEIWEKVARGGGELALIARQEQARVKRIQNKESEAIAIFDSILESEPTGELRFDVLAAKGEALYVSGAPSPEGMKPAIDIFSEALNTEDSPVASRYQSLFQLGKCYEKADQIDDAINSYHAAIEWQTASGNTETTSLTPEEYLWFYRCGDAQLRILEGRGQWQAAIKIAQKLQSVPGARALDAAARVERLKLENFQYSDE